jgi:uncharacterized protein YkwD
MRSIGGYSTMTYVGRIVVGLGLIGVGAGLVTVFQPRIENADPLSSLSFASDAPDTAEILRLVNATRNQIHVQPVTADAQLDAVAQERLKDMVDRQYYSHQNLKGEYYYNLFAKHGFQTAYSCENLNIDSSIMATEYLDDWLMSNEGHKDCLLNTKVSRVGMASGEFSKASDTAQKTYLVVTIYATPPVPLQQD